MRLLLVIEILQLCVTFVYSNSKLTCDSLETCGECVSFTEDKCVWCTEVSNEQPHCMSEISVDTGCNKEYRVTPTNKFTISPPDLVPDNLHAGDNVTGEDAIQFVPHNLKITTRPGIDVEFDMYYKPAQDYPIDIYYLMDHSSTMKKYTQDLLDQGKIIYNTLVKLTNNVRFGVGTFIEKPALPYALPKEHEAYSFKNHLNLTEEIEKFPTILKNVPFGANYEDPEAGLDALMQVMKCEKELNWREGARRIIVLCTDATYHSAGDGKMVGADVPNDMKCHLTNDKYDGELIYDYPSVSQIRKVATDGKFIIIFAAVKTVEKDYVALANAIGNGATYAPLQLETNANGKSTSNIVKIIEKTYLDSVQYVEISGSNWPSNVELKLEPNSQKRNKYNISHQEILPVKANLRVKNCDGDRNPLLRISPSGLREALTIQLHVDCECDCEKMSNKNNNSSQCSYNGTYQCGVCECNKGRSGRSCQCSMDRSSHSDSYKTCKANETDMFYCNGRGTCNCGKCDCNDGFSGSFCEYDDKACVRISNQLCAGHGRCRLGKCNCYPGWEGDDCNCVVNESTCTDPYSKKICSGNGVCRCGMCLCDMGDARGTAKNASYGGVFCDSCDACAKKRCQELETFVECHYFHNTTCDQKPDTVVHIVNRTEINSAKWRGEWCKKTLEGQDRWIVFRHYYDRDDEKIHVIIQDQLDVPPEADIWVPVGIAIGTVLLIGLLTVVAWKILVDYYDAKEYEKFAKEAREAGFEVTNNPFYVDPNIEFSNPAFKQ